MRFPISELAACLTLAFNSPTLPFFAKCTLRLVLDAPAATPHRARSDPERHSSASLAVRGNAGDRQSISIAESLKMSARNRYFLHSASSAGPNLYAKRIVAMRPTESIAHKSVHVEGVRIVEAEARSDLGGP